MKRRSYLPPFGKLFLTSLILSIIGLAGLVFLVFFSEPTLGPRWLFFFFLTMFCSGIALPIVYIIQRRLAKQYVPVGVLLREAIIFSIFVDLCTWLQLGRIISNLIILILAVGFILLEVFLRIAEKAAFKPEEDSRG
jgi:MFS family permease